MPNELKSILEQCFGQKPTLSKNELANAIALHFPDWTSSTITTKIHNLKTEGVLSSISRGEYSLQSGQTFTPQISTGLVRLHNKIKREFPFLMFCVWESRWFNEFMLHQLFRNYQVIEVEKDATESVFNSIAQSRKKAFLTPNKETFERYISNVDEAIIIKPLVTESPLALKDTIQYPTMEKLLVDMLIDKNLFAAQQGELDFIFLSAQRKYKINIKKMTRYAKRRDQEPEIQKLITETSAK